MSLILGQKSDDSSTVRGIKETGQALHTSEQGLIAGEHNQESAENGWLATREECNGTYLADGTITAQTVSSAPAHLMGIIIQQALAGTLTLTDSATNKLVLPAATPAGFIDFKAMRFETNLIVTLANAADDILVLWRPI